MAPANALGLPVRKVGLMRMGWANPLAMKRLGGAVRERWPDLDLYPHLHDDLARYRARAAAAG